MNALDFIIIGTQKGGTTSLYHYLSQHPAIAMPKDKEAPFFNQADISADRYQQFIQQHFTSSSDRQLLGKASPQYMSSPDIAQLIKSLSPNTKIITVLRDPIERAFSHYQMALRRGTETRSFNDAVSAGLQAKSLQIGRTALAPAHHNGYESEADFYIAWGEYGRQLTSYIEAFGKDNILVLFSEKLNSEPAQCLAQTLSFLGLPSDYTANNIDKKYHQGGGKAMFSASGIRTLLRLTGMAYLLSKLSEQRKQQLRFWFDQINIRNYKADNSLSPKNQQALHSIYQKDCCTLQQLGIDPPWQKQWQN